MTQPRQVLFLLVTLLLALGAVACGEDTRLVVQTETPSAANDSSGLATRPSGKSTVVTPTTIYDTSGLATRVPATDAAKTATRTPASKRTVTPTQSAVINGYETIAASALPPEARTTLQLIANNGPFPYKQDGVVFQNREQILPKKSSGYYHEYTVVTPGSPDRGARRIIKGAQGELYYTDDHYNTFKVILTDE